MSLSPRHRRPPALVLLVTAIGLCAACAAPPPYRGPEDYRARFSGIETITLVPPLVSVYAMSSGDIEQEVQEWSDAANRHAQIAVKAFIEKSGKRFVPFAGRRGPQPDFRLGRSGVNERTQLSAAEESWLLFETANESILQHTYNALETFPEQMKRFEYTLGPEARSLLDGTPADAFLLMIATDHVPTKDRQALVGFAAAAALYTGGYGGPGATPAELMAALVDARTGDILFFNKVSMPLADLRDADGNKALVDLVLKGLKR